MNKNQVMPISKFVARQLARPTGFIGRYLIAPLLNRANAKHNQLVFDSMSIAASDRVLEVGFGGAALLEKIAATACDGLVAGIDPSEDMVLSAASRLSKHVACGRLRLEVGSVDRLPYADAHFDKACSVNTIYFWPELSDGLAELHRVMRPGARLVLGFTCHHEMRKAQLHRRGFALYSPDELSAALARQGFRPAEPVSGSGLSRAFFALTAERTA